MDGIIAGPKFFQTCQSFSLLEFSELINAVKVFQKKFSKKSFPKKVFQKRFS
jgi:hypothetical protein